LDQQQLLGYIFIAKDTKSFSVHSVHVP